MNQPHPSMADERVELDLPALLGALRRSLKWLAPLTVGCAALTFVGLQLAPSYYKADSKILIEGSEAVYPGEGRGVEEERALLDEEGVASQVQLLTSRDLSRRVAKRLDLAAIPEFEAESGGLISGVLSMLGIKRDRGFASPEERVLEVYYDNLKVYRVEGSRVIAVEFSSQAPELAAKVSNSIVEEYLDLQAAAKRQSTEFAAAALEPQIKRLREDVTAAQERVETFRANNDLLLGADNQTLSQQQLGELSTQLSEARAARTEAEAKARLIRELLNSGGSLETASDVLNSQLIQRLRERQVALQSQIAELSTTLLPNHPRIRALNSQLADFDRQVRGEARKIMIGLENDAKIADSRVASLSAELDQLKGKAAKSAENQARLRELEREAATKSTQLDQMMQRFREADTRRNAEFLAADARVISRASVPLEPYWPKALPMTILVAIAAFILGTAWVIMREFLSGAALSRISYGGPEFNEAGREHRSAFAATRASSALPDGQTAHGAIAVANPGGAIAGSDLPIEPEKTIAHNVTVAPALHANAPAASIADGGKRRENFKRVAVLSVDSEEVAQAVTFRLARQAAEEGKLPLFLEVRPDMDDPQAVPGFAELLDGSASFAGVIYRDPASRAHVIESGQRAIDDDLTTNGRFDLVLEAIDHTYDQVFFDLGLIDDSLISAQILSLADKVVVATGGSPAGPELEAALNMLEEHTGAPVTVESADPETAVGRGRSSDMAA
ncbi:succinoglycan transporter [Rhizobiales bacterium]|uniref:GumC family protein n=1 Tax=Hongsoonwoonella zoysiae TaxID=2821844 RepID=UPI00156169A9|nr:exopolysaccharide transport family protein [Hongsoonwoonella zoysiae]NRG18435.1 succinoglycan transporter [Hongsoonwoonella zoysiae]